MKKKTIAAAKFKSKCLSLLSEVERNRQEIVVTRRGVPVARLVPLELRKGNLTGTIVGDIVDFSEPEWIR